MSSLQDIPCLASTILSTDSHVKVVSELPLSTAAQFGVSDLERRRTREERSGDEFSVPMLLMDGFSTERSASEKKPKKEMQILVVDSCDWSHYSADTSIER